MHLVKLPELIDDHWVSATLSELEALEWPETLFQLRGWDSPTAFGDAALIQLLATLDQRGNGFSVRLDHRLPLLTDSPRAPWWDRLRHDVAGFALIQLARNAPDSPFGGQTFGEVKTWQQQVLRADGGEVGRGNFRTLLCLDRPAAPRTARMFYTQEYPLKETESRIAGLVSSGGLAFQPLDDRYLERIASFVRETVDNTRDHGRFWIDGFPVEGIRYMQVRRTNVAVNPGSPGHEPADLNLIRDYSTAQYLERVRRLLGPAAATQKTLPVLALSIVDSGPGIAAQLCGSLEPYAGPPVGERDLLERAILDPTATSISAGLVARGGGLPDAVKAVGDLNGLLCIRSGRYLGVFDGTLQTAATSWQFMESEERRGVSVILFIPWLPWMTK